MVCGKPLWPCLHHPIRIRYLPTAGDRRNNDYRIEDTKRRGDNLTTDLAQDRTPTREVRDPIRHRHPAPMVHSPGTPNDCPRTPTEAKRLIIGMSLRCEIHRTNDRFKRRGQGATSRGGLREHL